MRRQLLRVLGLTAQVREFTLAAGLAGIGTAVTSFADAIGAGIAPLVLVLPLSVVIGLSTAASP